MEVSTGQKRNYESASGISTESRLPTSAKAKAKAKGGAGSVPAGDGEERAWGRSAGE